MDVIANFIIGSASNPVEMAVYFMLFMLLIDSIFNVVVSLIRGVRG